MSSNNQTNFTEKQITLNVGQVAKWASDITAIVVLIGPILAFAWYFQVSKPIDELNQKFTRIEQEMDLRRERLHQMDKNIAIMLVEIQQMRKLLDKQESKK